jgi:hypothetical protein
LKSSSHWQALAWAEDEADICGQIKSDGSATTTISPSTVFPCWLPRPKEVNILEYRILNLEMAGKQVFEASVFLF